MTSQIKQVSIQELNGGMQYDKDARRIPNKAFQNLVNVEYNKRGKLVKSKGYDALPIVCSGDVLDVQRVIDTNLASVGFLIAEGNTRFVSALTAAPTQDHSFARARSKFLKSPADKYFYLSDDGTGNTRSLRKWWYSSPYGIDGLAGVASLDLPTLVVQEATNLIRINQKDAVNDDSSLFFTRIQNSVRIQIPLPHPFLPYGEKVTKIHFPVKSDTVGTTVNCTVIIKDSSFNTIGTGNADFNHGDARVSIPLDTPIVLFPTGTDYITIIVGITTATWTVGEQVVLHRGLKFLTDSSSPYAWVLSNGSTAYYDREPVVGFELDPDVLASGDYEYSASAETTDGIKGNYGDIQKVTKSASNCYSLSLSALYAITNARADAAQLDTIHLGRTMVGGGTMYSWRELAYSTILTYKDYTSTSPWVAGAGEVFIPPEILMDFVPDSQLSATPLPTDHYTPDGLNPLMNGLVRFRNRAWMLVRVANINGIITTYLRYSEVDGYDYWDPLNEIGISDDLIEIQPLREDAMLGWSRTKTYVIIPSGSGFDWLKIADTGIGGSSMSSNVGITTASRFSCATNDAIYWVNERGAYKYDGSSVAHLPLSIQVLSLVLEAIAADAIFMSVEKDWAVWMSWDNKLLVLDFLNQCVVSQLRSQTILSATEDGVNLYLGYLNGIAQRSADWAEDTTALLSTIVTKRFAPDDLKRIQLYYFGLTYRVQESGSLYLTFEFSTGKIVTKTIDLTVGDNDLETVYLEVYGEGTWFQITMTHSANEDFEIVDYTLGASPDDVKFMGEE